MKRLTLLAVALVMVLGMAVSASAAPEVSISGNVLVNAVWRSNWDFADGNGSQNQAETQAMRIQERADLYFTVTANENLKGVIGFRSQRGTLGQEGLSDDYVGGAGTVGTQISIRDAYIDYNWPGTSVNVKVGLQPLALPAQVGGSMIQDGHAAAILASSAITDNVSVLGGWTRLYDSNIDSAWGANTDAANMSEIDAWILAVPVSFEGFAFDPFFVYAPLGENAVTSVAGNWSVDPVTGLAAGGLNTGLTSAGQLAALPVGASNKVKDAWWLGTDFNVSLLDPFIIKGDLNYGKVDGEHEVMDRSGWLFDIALDYTGFDFMNLSLTYAYTTGEDDDATNGSERMPILVEDWELGSFFFGGGLITGDDIGSGQNLGFHAVALSATGIQSFLEGLTHDAHIVYAKGTNDERSIANLTYGRSLTDQDSMWEVDFNTMYKIYDELTLYNGIGYINLDADEAVWDAANRQLDGGDAWKFQVGMVYQF